MARRSVVLGALLAAAACSRSAPPDWSFHAPPSWTAGQMNYEVGPNRIVGLWYSPVSSNGFRENITVLQQAKTFDSFDQFLAVSRAQLRAAPISAKVFSDRPTVMCGKIPGWYLAYVGTFSGRRLYSEQVIAEGTKAFYLATYSRLPNQPQIAAGKNALSTLCIKE